VRRLPAPPLLLITDRRQASWRLEDIVAAALAAGCRWISLREKDLDAAERLALLRRLVALGHPFGAIITVHGDIAAAAEAGAAGVHLPAGAAPSAARARLGPGALIGVSAHAPAELDAAAQAGADYATLSPIFPSASKPGYGPPLGLAALAGPSPIPVIALGGIEPANAAACLAAGAAGLAVMGPVMRARDPGAEIAQLLAAMTPRPSSTSGRAGEPPSERDLKASS
jgi:thiamine-phosphate pyrophosphorylase